MKSKYYEKTVLIVEDDPFWSRRYSSLLEGIFICKTVESYVDAIKKIRGSKIDALIVDLKLGDSSYDDVGWDGWHLAEEANRSGISSIIVTGFPNYSTASRAFREFNAIDFFSKRDFPEINSTFVQRVQEAVEETESRRPNKIGVRGKSKDKLDDNQKIKTIFICYSHYDQDWLNKFKKNLKVLKQVDQLTIWDDTKIKSGIRWGVEIKDALASAKVAPLLVTSDFIASDFVTNTELPVLFRAAKKRGLRILWVAVKPSLYDETYISEFQGTNNPNKPLSSLPKAESDQEIIRICKLMKEVASP